jgi:hypothetical protein
MNQKNFTPKTTTENKKKVALCLKVEILLLLDVTKMMMPRQ